MNGEGICLSATMFFCCFSVLPGEDARQEAQLLFPLHNRSLEEWLHYEVTDWTTRPCDLIGVGGNYGGVRRNGFLAEREMLRILIA